MNLTPVAGRPIRFFRWVDEPRLGPRRADARSSPNPDLGGWTDWVNLPVGEDRSPRRTSGRLRRSRSGKGS